MLYCGENHPLTDQFIVISDPSNESVDGRDLEIVSISDTTKKTEHISDKGCLSIPPIGRYIVRSKSHDWAKIFDAEDLQKEKIIKLEDSSKENLTIACDETSATFVGRDFSLKSILIDNVEHNFKEGFRVNYTVTKDNSIGKTSSKYNLGNADLKSKPFLLLDKEGQYQVIFTVRNLLKDREMSSRKCTFTLDATPPNANLAANLSNKFQSISHHRSNDIKTLKISDSLSFHSSDSDVKEIRYCATRLDDDFEDSDVLASNKWQNEISTTNCDGLDEVAIAPNSPIPFLDRNGFWTIRYKAVDQLGNASTSKISTVLFLHAEELELIRSQSMAQVSQAIQSLEFPGFRRAFS